MVDTDATTSKINSSSPSPFVDSTVIKSVPKGISASPSTIKIPTKNASNPNVFQRIAISINNIYIAIIDAFKSIFYWLFPQKLSKEEKKLIENENKLEYLKKDLYNVNEYSALLAIDKAKALYPKYNAFLDLAKNIEEANVDGITQKEQIKIAKEYARKNPDQLIAILKDYYTKRIEDLELKIEKQKKF